MPDYYGQVRRALATRRRINTLVGQRAGRRLPAQDRGPPLRAGADQAPGLRRLGRPTSCRSAFIEGAAAGLAIALLLGIGLTTTLLRRLERLRDATRELERRGPDAQPLPADGRHDEIGELARAFARMQARLRRQEAARRAFVATASHELRTPLASLDGMLELLEDDLTAEQLDIDDARERTARAREQSRRLSQLASDLLDLSRLDAEVELRSEPLELGEICRAVAAEFELAAAEREVAIERPAPAAALLGAGRSRAPSRASCASCSTTRCASPRPTRASSCGRPPAHSGRRSPSATTAPASRTASAS